MNQRGGWPNQVEELGEDISQPVGCGHDVPSRFRLRRRHRPVVKGPRLRTASALVVRVYNQLRNTLRCFYVTLRPGGCGGVLPGGVQGLEHDAGQAVFPGAEPSILVLPG